MKLTLFFTRGVSLQTWTQVGNLDRELAVYKALVEKGWSIRLVTYGPDDAALSGELPDGFELLCPTKPMAPSRASALLPVRFRHALSDTTLFKSNQSDGAWSAIIAARLAGAPVIIRCGYCWSEFYEKSAASSYKKWWVKKLEGWCFRHGDAGVVTSERDRQTIIRRHGVSPEKIEVIPNFVDTARFCPDKTITKEKGRVCFVGRLSDQKNLPALFRALAKTKGVRLCCIGDGPLKAELQGLAESLSLDVEFICSVPNNRLPQQINRAQVFVLPSFYEGHPKALIEAMSCGAAVVGTDVPGIREVISHEKDGLVCATDPDSIAEAVARLLKDAKMRARLEKAARETALDKYALEKIVEQEAALYMRVLENNKKASGFFERVFGGAVFRLVDFARRFFSPSAYMAFLLRLDNGLYSRISTAAGGLEPGRHPKHKIMAYERFFIENIKKTDRVLDVGSGTGHLAFAIANETGARVTGIEIDPKSVAVAGEKFAHENVEYMVADVMEYLPERPYNVVVLSNVLEHLDHRPKVLQTLAKNTGAKKFLIRVPCFDREWKTGLKKQMGVDYFLDPTHRIEYTNETFAEQVAKGNLEVISSQRKWGEIWAVCRPLERKGKG